MKKRYLFLVFGLIFGIYLGGVVNALEINTGAWSAGFVAFLGVSNSWQDIILSLIVIAIVFSVLYDIILFFPFITSTWVRFVVAAGLAIAAILTGLVRTISVFMLSFAAGMGAIGIFALIIGSLFVFFALSFGAGGWVKKWAEKMRAGQEIAIGDRKIHDAVAGIQEAREFHKGVKRT